MIMARDGTMRGGARVGAGKKKKPLADKVREGKTATVIVEPPEMQGVDMPPVKDFMTEDQRDGDPLDADKIYKETWEWLDKHGCASQVNAQLIEQYSMMVARWIQCEHAISKFGMLGKHPTTGAPMASPYVSMAKDYMKQINQTWYQIYQVVKDNCAGDYSEMSEDPMENLLKFRKA